MDSGIFILIISAIGFCWMLYRAVQFLLRWRRNSLIVEQSKNWPLTECTIQGAVMEAVGSARAPAQAPNCSFSYQVAGEYYSGCLFLCSCFGSIEGELDSLINRTLPIHYNPGKPEIWYIPLEQWEGCDLCQPNSPSFMSLMLRSKYGSGL